MRLGGVEFWRLRKFRPKRSRFFSGLVSTGLPEGSKRVTKGDPGEGSEAFFFNLARRCPSKLKGSFLDNRKIQMISFVLCVKSIYAFLNKYIKRVGLDLTIKKTLYLVDESNIWTMQHQWRAARLYRGRRPFPRVFKK